MAAEKDLIRDLQQDVGYGPRCVNKIVSRRWSRITSHVFKLLVQSNNKSVCVRKGTQKVNASENDELH